MAKTVTVDVRIMDLPQVQRFSASVTALLRALGECDGLPGPVTAAAVRLRRDVGALSPDTHHTHHHQGVPPWTGS
jgi:hypothetical protein